MIAVEKLTDAASLMTEAMMRMQQDANWEKIAAAVVAVSSVRDDLAAAVAAEVPAVDPLPVL